MLRRTLVVIVAMLACGCGKSEITGGSDKPQTLKLQLNWKPEPQFGGFYAAEVTKAFEKNGLTVEIIPGGAGAPTVQMIGAGTVPFGIVSGDEIVRARAQGNMVVALFAAFQTNPQGIMTRASRGLHSIEDIFTHPGTLAMERGLPYSDYLQKKYGFDKLKIIPSPFGDLSVYRTDENYAMQCFVTSEPLAAEKIGMPAQSFLIAESGYNPYTTVLATSDSYLKANPTIVKSMTQAVREGWKAYLADPKATNALMGKLNPTMDAATFVQSAEAQKRLIETESPDGSDLGSMSLSRWQQLTQQLSDLKTIANPVEAKDCFADVNQIK